MNRAVLVHQVNRGDLTGRRFNNFDVADVTRYAADPAAVYRQVAAKGRV